MLETGSKMEKRYLSRFSSRLGGMLLNFSRNGNLGLIRRNNDDPPDFVVELNEKQIGVEVTELVNKEFLRYNEENPQKPLNAYVVGDGFEMTQWNLQVFKERLLK